MTDEPITDDELTEWVGKGPRGHHGRWPKGIGNSVQERNIKRLIAEVRELRTEARRNGDTIQHQGEVLDLLRRSRDTINSLADGDLINVVDILGEIDRWLEGDDLRRRDGTVPHFYLSDELCHRCNHPGKHHMLTEKGCDNVVDGKRCGCLGPFDFR